MEQSTVTYHQPFAHTIIETIPPSKGVASMPHLASINTEHNDVHIERAVQSPTVQRSLPDLLGLHDTFGFDCFLASPPPTITSDPRAIREHIREYADQLERHERFTEIWKHQYANQLVNLRELIARFDMRCREFEQTLASSWKTDASSMSSSSSEDMGSDFRLLQLGLPEFEDLYYFLACKVRTLYSDLQLRFASHFLTMDDGLHWRGSSTHSKSICTVRDIRNFLRAIWFHLLHPVILRTIEAAINRRKYQTLKANPLVPYSSGCSSPTEVGRLERYKLGLNLDAPTLHTMFHHLDDVSAMSVPAMLLKVSQRLFGPPHTAEHMASQSHNCNSNQIWVDVEREKELTRSELRRVEGHHYDELEPNTSAHSRSKSMDGRHAGLTICSPRPIFDPTNEESLVPYGGIMNEFKAPITMKKIQNWQPIISNQKVHGLLVSTPGDRPDFPDPPNLQVTRKAGLAIPSPSSNYRMPFHGNARFPHTAPTPPPKSPSEVARAKELRMKAEMQQLQRDNSRLQEILQQNQVLKRENSQLQEVLLTSSASPRGVFRRLSQLGSRARSKSPRKSPYKSGANALV